MDRSDIVLAPEYVIEIQAAFRRNGVTPQDLKKMTSGDFFAQARNVVRGDALIIPAIHRIDIHVRPFVPTGWRLVEHRVLDEKYCPHGELVWDANKAEFYRDSEQLKEPGVVGSRLLERLHGIPVFNATVLDYLLANPHLIPNDWKRTGGEKGLYVSGVRQYIYFWGSIYEVPDDGLVVRYIYWDGSRWTWDSRHLNEFWSGVRQPALVHVIQTGA